MSTMKRKLIGQCPVCGKDAFGVVSGKAVHGWIINGRAVYPDPNRVCQLADGQTLKNRHMELVDLDSGEVAARCTIVSINPNNKQLRITHEKLVKSAGKPGLLARLVKAIKE